MKAYTTIFLLISILFVLLIDGCIEPKQVNYISSCSTLNESGAIYYLTENIINSSTSYCINISANNVILDCQNHKIDGDDSADYGIYVYRSSQEATNITIKNCIVSD